MIGRSVPEPTGRPTSRPVCWQRWGAWGWLLPWLGTLVALGGALHPAAAQQPPSPGPATPPPARRESRPEPPPRAAPRPSPAPTEAPPDLPAPGDDPGPVAPPAPGATEPPTRDDRVTRASAGTSPEPDDAGGNPLGPVPASVPPPKSDGTNAGAAPGAGGGGAASDPAESFALRSERLATGKQQVRLAVEVVAPKVINLKKEATIRLVVTNQGGNDVHGVILTYQLPEGLAFKQNDAREEVNNQKSNPQIYTWNKALIAANGDWTVTFRVEATDARASCEHLASVTAKAGTKERTMIQEPKLHIDAQVNPSRPLKGEQVNYEVSVHNPGSGPARDVTVTARLGDGLELRGTSEKQFEQKFPIIKPGETIRLDPLLIDTANGGKQKCEFEVTSPDVVAGLPEHKASKSVEVLQPLLDVQVAAQEKRLAGQPIEYKVTVRNVGTAPAQAVVVSAFMPTTGGKLHGGPPSGGQFIKGNDRKIVWRIPRLDTNEPIDFQFLYDTGTIGTYKCAVEAVSGPLRSNKSAMTEVVGLADLDLKVTQTARVIDVGGSTLYDFTIRNYGTKEATKIQVRGELTNLKIKSQYSDTLAEGLVFNDKVDPPQFIFPEIPRLAAGDAMTLTIEVVGLRAGQAGAVVTLVHGEAGSDDATPIKQSIFTRVTDNKSAGR